MVGYGDNERLISDNAQAQSGRNHKNTISSFSRFMGLGQDCTAQLNKEKKFITAKIAPRGDKKIAFKVNKGEPIEVLPEQVYAAFLHMAKCYFTNAADRPDVVLSVPPYFSAVERQSVLDAA